MSRCCRCHRAEVPTSNINPSLPGVLFVSLFDYCRRFGIAATANLDDRYLSGFMKTVLKTACIEIAGMFLGNRSDSVHKCSHVALRVLSNLCSLSRSYAMPMQVFDIVSNKRLRVAHTHAQKVTSCIK